MKRIYLVLSLGLLVLTTACGGLLGKKEKTNKQSVANSVKNSIAKATEALELTKNYYAIDEDQPVIIGEIKDGKLWLTFMEDEILPLGVVDEDSYRLPDYPIQVEGLQGAPKDFIIADIGQDFNPILCVLTDQDKVQMLSLWNTIATGDIEVTEVPMESIVEFKDGPGGPWKDDEGNTFYEYTTIYGIDAQGGRHEVPLYSLEHDIEHVDHGQQADVVYQLFFTDDWKMRYVMGYYLSEKLEEQTGHFWLIDEDWDEMVFTFGYELTTRMEYTGEGIITTAVENQGVFEMRYVDFGNQGCMVSPIEGLDFCNNGMDKPVQFKPCGTYGG